MADPTIIIAFGAGVLSFMSPCVLPLIPGFLAYLSGTGVKGKNARLQLFLNSVAFVLGFSVIFALIGVLLNTVLKYSSYTIQTWLSRFAGIIIIVFGLYVLKLIHIPFLEREHKLRVRKKFGIRYVTSFVFGAAFAVGWTPCVSAILGSILALVITRPGLGFILLMAYALGLGIPFLIVGLFSVQALKWIQRSRKIVQYGNIIVGVLLVILGVLVFTNQLNVVANWFVPAYIIS